MFSFGSLERKASQVTIDIFTLMYTFEIRVCISNVNYNKHSIILKIGYKIK